MNLADYLDAYAAQPSSMMARQTTPSYFAPASSMMARGTAPSMPTKSFSLVPAIPSASMLVRTVPPPPSPPPPPPQPSVDQGKPAADQGTPPPPPPVKTLVQPAPPVDQRPSDLPSDSSESSGDSGTSSSGFGWLLIVVGGYLFYRGAST